MEVTIGKEGVKKTWQAEFPETIKCYKCKGLAQIGFVAHEGMSDNDQNVSRIYNQDLDEEGLWPHDCCAVAVYFCRGCFKVIALFNQA